MCGGGGGGGGGVTAAVWRMDQHQVTNTGERRRKTPAVTYMSKHGDAMYVAAGHPARAAPYRPPLYSRGRKKITLFNERPN